MNDFGTVTKAHGEVTVHILADTVLLHGVTYPPPAPNPGRVSETLF